MSAPAAAPTTEPGPAGAVTVRIWERLLALAAREGVRVLFPHHGSPQARNFTLARLLAVHLIDAGEPAEDLADQLAAALIAQLAAAEVL